MSNLVSIITPTYNHEGYIDSCIRSVMAQSYSNWEMLIVDDASMDETRKIIKKFTSIDSRISLISHRDNWGISRLVDTYNQALSKCRGKYIAILEGDDFWPADKLKIQMKSLLKSKAVFSYGDWVMTNQFGEGIHLRQYDKYKLSNLRNRKPSKSILKCFNSLRFDIASSTVIMEAKSLRKIGGFTTAVDYPFVDVPTYLQFSLMGEWDYVPSILGYYRRHETSTWFAYAMKANAMGRDDLLICIDAFIETNKIDFGMSVKDMRDREIFLLRKRKNIWLSNFLNKALFPHRYNFIYWLISFIGKRKFQQTLKKYQ